MRKLGRPKRRWEDNVKMDLQEVGWWDKDWIELVHVRDRWQALVMTVKKFWFQKMLRISRVAENLSDFEEGLCSME